MEEINEAVRCVEDIEDMTRPLLERLWNKIFRKQAKVVMGLGVITHEQIEIYNCSEEDEKDGIGVVHRILEVVIEVSQTT